ncbi:MAG: hypothetical protein ACFFBD_26625, partial [Candidatus Hodarchaeota archaeon]
MSESTETATEEKWTVREEVKEVLRRRTTVEGQFTWIKNFYKDEISQKIEEFQVNERTVVAGYYLARHVMDQVGTHLYKVDEATFEQELITDDVRVNLIVKTLMESSKYYPGKSIDERVAYYSVISQITKKIYRSYIDQKKRYISPRVILVNLVDSYFNPLFNFFKEEIPGTDFRWVMAEMEAFLRSDFPQKYYEKLVRDGIFPKTFEEVLFFEAGAHIVSKYLDWTDKIEKFGLLAVGEEEAAEEELKKLEEELEAIEAEISTVEEDLKGTEEEVAQAQEMIKAAEAEIKALEEDLKAAEVDIRVKEVTEGKKIQTAQTDVEVAETEATGAKKLETIVETAKVKAKTAEVAKVRAAAKFKAAEATKIKAAVEVKVAEAELKAADAEKLKSDIEVKKAEVEVRLKRTEEIKKRKIMEAQAAKFKAVEAARDKDYIPLGVGGKHPYVYAVSAFYNLPHRRLVAQPLPTDIADTFDELVQSSKQIALVNQPQVNQSSYFLKYAKFLTLVGSGYEKKVRNYFALNHESEEFGLWQKFVISTEAINISSVSVYLKERCQNIIGSLKIYNATHSTPEDIPLLPVTQYWDEAIINSTEEGDIEKYIFAKDIYREMKYVPLAILQISETKGEVLLRKEWGRDGQVEERKLLLSLEEVEKLLNITDVLGRLLFNETGLIYANRDEYVDLAMHPMEVLFIHKEDPNKVLFVIFQYDEETKTLIGLIATNREERDRRQSFVKQMLHSKTHQLISGLRVKPLLETAIMKMGEENISAQNVLQKEFSPVWMYYSALTEEIKSSPQKSNIEIDHIYEKALEKQADGEFITPEQKEEEQYKQNFV